MIRFIMSLLFGGSSIPWIVGGIAAAGLAFFGWLTYHDHELWNKATQEFNAKQDAIVQQQKEEFDKKTTQIQDDAARIRAVIAESQKQNHDTLSVILKNADGNGAAPASPYLKSIVKQLNDSYGEKK